MTDPTLRDCINYMKQQLKGMEKYPKSYEFNIPYYRKTIELLETRGTTNGNCATCVKAVVIDERPHGTCKTCKHYVTYRGLFSYGESGDGYCKSDITNSEGKAFINCHDEWYCANYEKEGEAE